jgi:hypothetical protein
LILDWGQQAHNALENGALVEDIIALDAKNRISELATSEDYKEVKHEVSEQMDEEFEEVLEA